ncbi:CHAT domain-containing protein [Mycena sp. CBHHK59/15]|nr:CHAT domain-containing protein [Mycena sp. CBHHK59/15]
MRIDARINIESGRSSLETIYLFADPNWPTKEELTKVIKTNSKGNPSLAKKLESWADLLTVRFNRSGKMKDLEAALKLNETAVSLMPPGHPDLPRHLQGAAIAFRQRYLVKGKLEDIDTALERYQAAVALTLKGHHTLPALRQYLGTSFDNRFNKTGQLEDLQAVLQNKQESVSLTLPDAPELPGRLRELAAVDALQMAIGLTARGNVNFPRFLQRLAVSLTDRYLTLGNLKDLDAALQNFETVKFMTPQRHPEPPSCLQNLSASYRFRFQRLGDLKDLETSLQISQEAVAMSPPGSEDLPRCLEDVASSYGLGFKISGDLDDLAVAQHSYQADVDQTITRILQRIYRYQKLGDLGDLEAAWHNAQRAVNATSEDHSDLPQYLHGLAIALTSRHERLGDVKDMEAALGNIQKAVSLTAPDHANLAAYLQSLALAYSIRYKYSGDMKDIELAFSTYRDAFGKRRRRRSSLGEQPCIGHRWDITIARWRLATSFQRQLQLKTEVKELPQTEADRLAQLSLQLYSGASKNPHGLAIERNYSLAEIRKRLHFEYFLLPKPYKSICQVSQNGPVVILTSHIRRRSQCTFRCQTSLLGCSSFSGRCSRTCCSAATRGRGKRKEQNQRGFLGRRNAWLRSQRRSVSGTYLPGSGRTWYSVYARCWSLRVYGCPLPTAELIFTPAWHLRRPLVVVSDWSFAGLPLHAAAPSDDFVQSYTSTLGALLNANAKKPSASSPRIGVVGVTHIDVAGEASLPGVKKEIARIVSTVGEERVETLRGEQATVQAVTRQLRECGWMHFACHGKQDLHDPPKSCLQLYSGTLELETILREGAEFVYLAACQTAMGDAEMVNESFHLGGGLITAGFRGAIGTMWSIRDEDGLWWPRRFTVICFRETAGRRQIRRLGHFRLRASTRPALRRVDGPSRRDGTRPFSTSVSGLDGRVRDGWTRQRGTRYPSVDGLTGQPKTGSTNDGHFLCLSGATRDDGVLWRIGKAAITAGFPSIRQDEFQLWE